MRGRIALAAMAALALSIFTAPAAIADPPVTDSCSVVDHTLSIVEDGAFALTLQIDDEDLVADHAEGGVCQNHAVPLSTIQTVEVTQPATVRFLLDDAANGDVADWNGLRFDILVTSGDGVFDASAVDDWSGVDVRIGWGGDFAIERGYGDLDVAGTIVFVGSPDRDTFDAHTYSGVVEADGGFGDDRLYGGYGDDELDCASFGDDECSGGDGDDTLVIGRGDIAAPGDGDDRIDAYSTRGDWTLTYADSSSGIEYDARYGGYVRSRAGDDRIDGDSPLTVIGSRYGDEIIGDEASETLEGGDGADLIRGRQGADRIFGGGGNDTLYGGRDADSISGGYGDDVLYGRRGNDLLRGDAGFDRLYGGEDRDSCIGEVENTCER